MNIDSFAHDQAPSRSDDATCRRALAALLLCAGFAAGTPAFGQSAQTLQLRSLASTCANCHGTDGRAVVGSAIPALAGLPRVAGLLSRTSTTAREIQFAIKIIF